MHKFKLLYADPPWKYGSGGARGGRYGGLDYPTMSTKEICQLPVNQIVNDDAILLLWFTGSFMGDAISVGNAWGFNFTRIDKVWVKTKDSGSRHAVPGPWGMSDCEFLALFTRGKAIPYQSVSNQFVSYSVPYPGKHSRKPEFFRRQIEERFDGTFPRVELFARERSLGWHAFGNEIQGSINLK